MGQSKGSKDAEINPTSEEVEDVKVLKQLRRSIEELLRQEDFSEIKLSKDKSSQGSKQRGNLNSEEIREKNDESDGRKQPKSSKTQKDRDEVKDLNENDIKGETFSAKLDKRSDKSILGKKDNKSKEKLEKDNYKIGQSKVSDLFKRLLDEKAITGNSNTNNKNEKAGAKDTGSFRADKYEGDEEINISKYSKARNEENDYEVKQESQNKDAKSEKKDKQRFGDDFENEKEEVMQGKEEDM